MTIRLLVAVAAVAAMGACGGVPQGSAPAPAGSSTSEVRLILSDFKITPSKVQVANPDVTIEVRNEGPTPHNLYLATPSGQVVLQTRTLAPGQSQTVRAKLQPGTTYTTYCALPGHRALGMEGSLSVAGQGGSG